MRFLVAILVFFLLNGIFRGQGVGNSSNYGSGNQAGRDIVIYDNTQLDNGVVSLALEISRRLSKSSDVKLKEFSDSLYFLAQNALKNPKSRKDMDLLNDYMISVHTQSIRDSLSDKELNVLNFIEQTSIDSANVKSGGICMGYTYYPFRFKMGENFKKYIFPFKNGFARIGIIPRDTVQRPKFGMINRYNVEIIPSIYDSVYDMSEGTILVRLGNDFYFFDTSGKKLDIIKDNRITDVYPFSCGYAACKIYNLIYYVDRNGNFLLDTKGNLVRSFVSSFNFIKYNRFAGEDDYYILTKKKGKAVAEKSHWVESHSALIHNYVSVFGYDEFEKNYLLYKNLSGYNSVGVACTGHSIIDTNFNVIRSIPYASISMIENGFKVTYRSWHASADTSHTYSWVGVLNSKGEEIASRNKYFDVLGTNYEFWVVINWDGERSVINKRGHELFPFRIQIIEFLSENLLKVTWYEGSNLITKYYALDEDGNPTDVDECE